MDELWIVIVIQFVCIIVLGYNAIVTQKILNRFHEVDRALMNGVLKNDTNIRELCRAVKCVIDEHDGSFPGA